MDIAKIAEDLKVMDDGQLATLMQSQNPQVPGYLVLGELDARNRMRSAADAGQQAQEPTMAQQAAQQAGERDMMARSSMQRQVQGYAAGGPVLDEEKAGIGALAAPTSEHDWNFKSMNDLTAAPAAVAGAAPQVMIPWEFYGMKGAENVDWAEEARLRNLGNSVKGGIFSPSYQALSDADRKAGRDYNRSLQGGGSRSQKGPGFFGMFMERTDPLSGFTKLQAGAASSSSSSSSEGGEESTTTTEDGSGGSTTTSASSGIGALSPSERLASNKPRFFIEEEQFAGGGPVGGLVPLTRDPVTGQVRFGQ